MGKFQEGARERLILVARHSAWLAAVPKAEKADASKLLSNRDAAEPDKAPRLSRRERFEKDEEDRGIARLELVLPEVDVAGHLIEYLYRAGPGRDGMGLAYQEILAWSILAGVELTPWEAETLRAISAAYMHELHEAEDPKRPAPYVSPLLLSRKMIADKVLGAFRQINRIRAGEA